MKKSIVLLVSLLFISALSILILKNLEETNTFIKEKNHKINKIQVLTSFKNTQVQISKIILENNKNIDEIIDKLNSEYMPFTVGNISIKIMLNNYNRVDVNLLLEADKKKYQAVNDLFLNNDISSFDTFRYIFKSIEHEYKTNTKTSGNIINNSKQIDDIINNFIKETYSDEILNIKDELGFIKKDEKEKLYELFVKVNYLNNFAKAYYVLNEKGVVKYFESSFK
jgi:hypothetical protein